MSYISSEMRERHAFVDAAQSELAEILAQPEVAERLGGEEHSMLLERNEQIFVPNMRDNTVRIPQKYARTECIPVLALSENASFNCGPVVSAQTPIQQANTYDWLVRSMATVTEARRLSKATPGALRTAAQKQTFSTASMVGSTQSVAVTLTLQRNDDPLINNEYMIFGRPIVTLDQTDSYHAATVLAHELTHADDGIFETPALLDDPLNAARWELKAFRNGGILARHLLQEAVGLSLNERASITSQLHVEAIRAEYADPENPYTPNEPMLAAIREIYSFPWATLPSDNPEQPNPDL